MDLDSFFGTQPAAKPFDQVSQATPGDDPFAAFSTVDGAAAAVAAPSTQPMHAPDSSTYSDDLGQPPPLSRTAPAAADAPSAASSYGNILGFDSAEDTVWGGSAEPVGDSNHSEQFAREQEGARPAPVAGAGEFAGAPSEALRSEAHGTSNHASAAQPADGDDEPGESQGNKGMFKGWLKKGASMGKKALRAAQAGLQHLEHALDKMDSDQAHKQAKVWDRAALRLAARPCCCVALSTPYTACFMPLHCFWYCSLHLECKIARDVLRASYSQRKCRKAVWACLPAMWR